MLLPAGSLQGMLTRRGVSAHLPTSVIGACTNKLRCLGRTPIKEDREQEWGTFNGERLSLFKMHCCLVDKGTWPWWAVNSSLVHLYHLFLYTLDSWFTRRQEPICSEESKLHVVSKILWFPLSSTACNLETVLQSFSRKSRWHVKARHTVLRFQDIARGFVVPMTACNADVQMPIPHSASWDGKIECHRSFLSFCPNGKCSAWSYL